MGGLTSLTGGGGFTGGAAGPAKSGNTNSISFGGNSGIGNTAALSPVQILLMVAALLILLLFVIRKTK